MPSYVQAAATPKAVAGPLAAATDEQMLGFGVPAEWLSDVRQADEAGLLGLAGPARVAGSAGTGKTVVALHRAVHLARASPNGRILLTTFSKPLAHALRANIKRLICRPRMKRSGNSCMWRAHGREINSRSAPSSRRLNSSTNLGSSKVQLLPGMGRTR